MTGDPNRLIHDPTIAAVLRRDLGLASEQGVGFDVTAGLRRFESTMAADLARGTGATATTGSGGFAVGAMLLAGGLAAALGWQLAGPTKEPVPAVLARQVTVDAEVSVSPTPVRVPVIAPAPARADAVSTTEDDRRTELAATDRSSHSRRARSTRDDGPSTKMPADYLREARELNAARAFLGRDPSRALALADEGRAAFAAGAFVQEWEGVAVLALFELGRGDEARTRGAAFLDRYPNGTYAPGIRAALQGAR